VYDYILRRIRKIHLSLDSKFKLPSDVPFSPRAYSRCMTAIRVLIVDDVPGVRQDLRTFLSLAGDIEIVGEARDGREAVRLVEALCPQVILMDLEMPLMDGFEAAREIKVLQPSCRVVALTIHGGETERHQAFQAGMADVIVKGAPLDVLLQAIRVGTGDDQGTRM
jgi:DNA-binding NarL/FixJ family response regulator